MSDTMPYVMEATGELTKPEWLEVDLPPAAGEMPETSRSDAANDVDGEDAGAEHERADGPDGETRPSRP